MTVFIKATDPKALDEAVGVFKAGGLAAIPTETVYGLGADASNGEAVARIYEVKGRPDFNPLIAHCSSLEMAQRYGHFSQEALKVADHFWPGPLTLVLPYKEDSGLSPLVRAGLKTIGLRVPNGVSQPIIKALNRPIAAPSANLSGRISPTTAEHVQSQLDGLIDLIIDGGPCHVGLESTILTFDEDKPFLLRAGGIEAERLEDLLGSKLQSPSANSPISAPGQLASHYAPKGTVRLNVNEVGDEDGALNFGDSQLKAAHVESLSKTGDLREAASRLFAALSAFDEKGVKHIAVAPIPEKGLGVAINDRLRRAAAPRPIV